MVERAVSFFRTRQGNCAQSVAHSWCEKMSTNCEEYEHLHACGHGRAPDGTCGALYAAKLIAGPERAAQIEAAFAAASGGFTKCRDIRTHRAMSCVQCVSTAARLLYEQRVCQEETVAK
ncbi:MAG: hypothetical protein ACP5VQ_06265 [Phycisphaerae bacterium]